MLEKIKNLDRTWLILSGIIMATIPCYCMGFALLWTADARRAEMTPTATETAAETPGDDGAPTLTATEIPPSATPTITLTFTATTTFALPPTKTPTPTLTLPPTLTQTPPPVATATYTPTPTETFTPTPTIP